MSTASKHDAPEKKATLNGLIIIGFFGLVVAGMLLAVYASRYVPETLSRLAGAVYLSSDAAKNVSTTTAPGTKPTPEPATPAVVTPEPVNPTFVGTTTTPELPDETGYTPRTTTYTPPRVVQTGPRLYGYPDLALTNVRTGYFSGGYFIEDSRIPRGSDMAIVFTVTNGGTNAVANWLVRVRVEGQRDAIAYGGLLYPNGYQNFTLRATDVDTGTITTRIEVDYQNAVPELNESNNYRSIDVDVGGSRGSSRNVSCEIDASDTRVDEGDRITLEWDTSGNPNYASINQGIGRVDEDSGSERVRIDDDTTFRMTVRNSRGDEDTCSVTVRVN